MPDAVLRLLVVAAVIGVASIAGWWWNRRDGAVRTGESATRHGGFTPDQLTAVGLEVSGAEAVALLLGSPTCAPCVSVKRILGEVTEERPTFRWVYVDAAAHLDIAEAHHVMRVPTLFVLDPDGRILARTSGVPAKRDLLAVLDREGDLEPAA